MKNLTVNKIAIGLFLTGYAASSAFAISATTDNFINGNAPIIQSKATTPVDHQMTVKILNKDNDQPIGNRPAKVGDRIQITFKVADADGDKVTNTVLKNTFKVFIKKQKDNTSEPWSPINFGNNDVTVTMDDEEATIQFRISDAFAGAEKIGYQILERTDYGVPPANKWLLVTDIWNRTAGPSTVDWTEGSEVANPGTGDHGPGDSSADGTGTGPIESEDTKVGIFKYDGATIDPALDYSRNGTLIPKYGDKFAAVVWFDTNKDGKLTAADGVGGDVKTAIKTGSYTYTWTLSGEYKPAGAQNPPAVKTDKLTYGVSDGLGDYATAAGNVILLGSAADSSTKHNANYDSSYLAGAQGFKLTVTTN